MKNRFFLTNNGNILVFNGNESFFAKTDGELIRQCTGGEFDYLSGVCPEIAFISLEIEKELRFQNIVLPKWEPITSALTMADYTDYDSRFCNNGGNYSFSVTSYFFGAVVNGEFVIRRLDIGGTSAEFEYDEINCRFQSGLSGLTCINAVGCPTIFTQSRSGENKAFVLEDYTTIINVEEFLSATCTVTPERYSDETETVTPLFSMEQIEEYKQAFISAGYVQKRTRGGDRRGNLTNN